ncbi:diazepam-binding inhibitor [Zopfia rhizophila CBS 207.26]|uniref:Diazepam-binding inhibitor n=1 Tax=Zopfia rhizophila CBS 207.26 TaxID=1314779 RepID=A0A6A6DQS5_9PEZI|nr:diazepam-binding inhibitor [Zopfia rhizophila CBS 207.26]
MPSPAFETAWKESQQLDKKPTNDEMLDLYAYGKIAKQEEVKKPGLMDVYGKAKYNHWQKIVENGIHADEAEKKYIDLVSDLKTKYGFNG